jgi:hypothetical protein
MLPAPVPEIIPISIAKHVFTFRRLTWRDDMRFHLLHEKDPKLTLLAYAMVGVDGKRVASLQDAQRMVMGLPKPVRERLVILYRGSLPDNRMLDALLPAAVPEPKVVQAMVDEEAEDEEEAAEKFLERKFGPEEAREANEQAELIARASGMRGATAPIPDRPEELDAPASSESDVGSEFDEETTTILGPDVPTSRRYQAVM